MLLIDADLFKQINDRFGHPAGDAVLRGLAERLRRLARAEDLVARYGGEEFAVVLPEVESVAAVQVRELALRRAIAEVPFASHDTTIELNGRGAVTLARGETRSANSSSFNSRTTGFTKPKRAGRNRVFPSPSAYFSNRSGNDDTPPPTGLTREILL